LSLLSDKLDQMIYQGTTMIDTAEMVVGQVNGLTVLSQGGHSFGKPVRITARTSPGWAGVVDLEREIGESGPSHTKGVLILSGYLSGRFAQDNPLTLTASLCFEQMYDEVDGDSASSAELYALLSCLAGVEIKQSLAVTGSVNQRGEIQAVGGVTHKIESFFRICRHRGLNGEQGVIIPEANVRNLMLREEVVEAVRAGTFHIYAINSIDQGIELLTGIPAGKPDRENRYLEGTINARVIHTLRSYNDRVRAFGPTIPGMMGRH
jgi:predicted ATP-dependent protease